MYVDERSYDKQPHQQKLHDFADDTAPPHKSKWKLSFFALYMWRFALLVCKINIVLHYFAFDMKFRNCNKDDALCVLSRPICSSPIIILVLNDSIDV